MRKIHYLIIVAVLVCILLFVGNFDYMMNCSQVHRWSQVIGIHGNADVYDYYGQACRIDIVGDDTVKTLTVVSAGRDHMFDTKDDVSYSRTEYNKSKIVGKWIGSKTKQFGKGLIEGFKQE